jgi:chromate transporter
MRGRDIIFLKDVLVVAVTSFGGPQGHLAVMHHVLVKKRRYYSEEELLETNALCQMLPGPASTQTIIALAQKKGGPVLAILSLLVWILPACAIMSAVAFAFTLFERSETNTAFLIFIPPMAIGFITFAGFSLARKVIRNETGLIIMLLAIILAVIFPSPWTFPSVVLGSMLVSYFISRETATGTGTAAKINWNHSWLSLLIFFGVFIMVAALALITREPEFVLFENFFRFGTITFGGGNVLVPMMFEQFVKHRDYLSSDQFMSGYAISQAIPGPSFSFAAFTGGLAMQNYGAQYILLGCLIGTVAIFLPGALMIFFIYPFWQYLRHQAFVRRALAGVNAASAGLVFSGAIILFANQNFMWMNLLVIAITFILLWFTNMKAPWLVLMALACGFLYNNFYPLQT